MAIEELVKLIPPPSEPLESGDVDSWIHVTRDVGLNLPEDLREFGQRYGSGMFCRTYLQVFNPFSVYYRQMIDYECALLRKLESICGLLPYNVHPHRPGLLPCGRDEEGDGMYWLTDGDPNKWPIMLRSRDEDVNEAFERWDVSLTTFLAGILSNETKCLLWHRPFSKKLRIFTPGRTQAEVAANHLKCRK